MRLGRLRIDVVRGPEFRLDGGAMFGVVPKVLWEKKLPADARNRVRLATNCLLVRGAGFTALVESGIGSKWDAKARDLYAIDDRTTLTASLGEHSVEPEDVDALVLSHLHSDHAGGSTRSRARAPCPRSPTPRSTSRPSSSPTRGLPTNAIARRTGRTTGSRGRRGGVSRRSRARWRCGQA